VITVVPPLAAGAAVPDAAEALPAAAVGDVALLAAAVGAVVGAAEAAGAALLAAGDACAAADGFTVGAIVAVGDDEPPHAASSAETAAALLARRKCLRVKDFGIPSAIAYPPALTMRPMRDMWIIDFVASIA
jgi:hypothetical protein